MTIDSSHLRLYTCAFRDWQPEMGVLVRTSVSHPRGWKGPPMCASKVLTPLGIFGVHTEYEPYREAYRRRLDKYGIEGVLQELETIAYTKCLDSDEPCRLNLACFCDLEKSWCHRRLASEWLEEHTGIAVPEARRRVLALTS
jgi:hypothetical protein